MLFHSVFHSSRCWIQANIFCYLLNALFRYFYRLFRESEYISTSAWIQVTLFLQVPIVVFVSSKGLPTDLEVVLGLLDWVDWRHVWPNVDLVFAPPPTLLPPPTAPKEGGYNIIISKYMYFYLIFCALAKVVLK